MEKTVMTRNNDEIRVLCIRIGTTWSYVITDGDLRCRSMDVDEVIEYVRENSQCGDKFIEDLILAMDDGYINAVTFAKTCF